MSMVAAPRPTGRLPLLALSLGHGCADLSNSALLAVLPFLVDERHYTYAEVGVFALAVSVAAAVLQPLLGARGTGGRLLADARRAGPRWARHRRRGRRRRTSR